MRNVLLMTDFYYPNPSANGICVEKLAQSMISMGHKVSVLAYGIGKDAEYQTIDGIEIFKVRAPLFYQVREMNKGRGFLNVLFQIFRFFRFLRIALFLPIYPMIYPAFAIKYKNMAIKIVEKNNIDLVVAEYIPIEALFAGEKVKTLFPNILFQVYVVDTFTQSPNAINYKLIGKVSKKWENRMIRHSDNYFYISSFDSYYQTGEYRSFENKMNSIGFPLVQNNCVPIRKRQNTIHLLYTGSWGGERNPEKIFCAIENMRITDKIQFMYCGKENATSKEMIKKFPFVCSKGFIHPKELNKIYMEVDILVNLGNSTDMVPSKLFTYISTGLPILHLYIKEDDPCISLLEKYENSRCLALKSVTAEELETAIFEIIDNRVEYAKIEENYIQYTAKYISNCLLSGNCRNCK